MPLEQYIRVYDRNVSGDIAQQVGGADFAPKKNYAPDNEAFHETTKGMATIAAVAAGLVLCASVMVWFRYRTGKKRLAGYNEFEDDHDPKAEVRVGHAPLARCSVFAS